MALERFLASDALAARLAGGWHVRLEPVNVHEYHRARGSDTEGTWPGIDDTWATDPAPALGPVVSLTLAKTRMSQLPRTLRATIEAGKALGDASGLVWGVALARPPIIATVTLWSSAEAADTYAYRRPGIGHRHAMDVDRVKPLHDSGVFIRFRPIASFGSLQGRYPLPADWLAVATAEAPK